MTLYRSCTGCILEKKPCQARDAVRKHLKGFGVTSLKWKCKSRVARISIGDPVWVLTVAGNGEPEDRDGPSRDFFPGIAVRDHGTKMLVVIQRDAPGRDDPEITFSPTKGSGNGFCKIPLSRIEKRDGERVKVCEGCWQPEFMGHADGYFCGRPMPAQALAL